MERLVLTMNGIGPAREVREGSRTFIVAPGTLIVEGVLPGSKGPLFYPAPEIKSSAATWNGTLITLGHPTDPKTGTHLSAKSPGVADRLGMGVLRNAHFNGSLRADLWFDVAKTERIDAGLAANVRILPRLRQGKPIELSTGLFTRNDPAPLGATHNGRAYTHVARNYRPDHLAVLVDQVGACSLSMGCGVLVNQAHTFDWPDVFNCRSPLHKGPCKGYKRGSGGAGGKPPAKGGKKKLPPGVAAKVKAVAKAVAAAPKEKQPGLLRRAMRKIAQDLGDAAAGLGGGIQSILQGAGVMATFNESDRFPDLFGVLNCGGKGGKPGPCPSGGEAFNPLKFEHRQKIDSLMGNNLDALEGIARALGLDPKAYEKHVPFGRSEKLEPHAKFAKVKLRAWATAIAEHRHNNPS